MENKTEQEKFWEGNFGAEYISRNIGSELLAANVSFFARALNKAGEIKSVAEFGANVGMNLSALRVLYPSLELNAIEINSEAANTLKTLHQDANVFCGSIKEFGEQRGKNFVADLSLIKTVLIHVNPKDLPDTYRVLFESSSRYILVAEYYNTTPVAIEYRGHKDRLFKRDFAGELQCLYPQLKLVDYGFVYHGEKGPVFNLIDDISWFLLEKVQ